MRNFSGIRCKYHWGDEETCEGRRSCFCSSCTLPIPAVIGAICLLFAAACDEPQLAEPEVQGTDSAVYAKKGGKPPGPPVAGTIYFSDGDLVYAMDGDGGNKRSLPAGVTGIPSRETHGDYRWFLHVEPVAGTYSDGVPRQEVFATGAEPGSTSTTTVQLTNDPNVHPRGSLRWSPGDAKLGFRGRRLDATGHVTEGGLFVLEVSFASGTPVSVGSPVLVVPTAIGSAGEWCVIGSGEVCEYSLLGGFDWSPGMDHIVYGDGSLGTVRIHGGIDLAEGYGPKWSPPTTDSPEGRILFNVFACCLWTVEPDGLGLREVVRVRSPGTNAIGRYARGPYWSPTGEHFVYFWEEIKLGGATIQYQSRVNRVEANGRSEACLTCGDFDYARPLGWW